jgi:hypothetical protein
MPYTSSAPLYADAVSYFDGSFVKIRNITLGYTLPKSLLAKVETCQACVYTALPITP